MTSGVSEDRYWQSFLQGNEDAFSSLYSLCVQQLYAYGVSLGFSSDTCLDAIQDVFYKLYIRKNELRHVTHLRVYLFRSLRNRLFDIHKKQKNMESLNTETTAFAIEVSVSEKIENEEERAMLKQKVDSLLQLLTDRQREAIYLRYMQNLEYDEIATMMEMNSESVRKLVYRALETIRKSVKNTPFSILTLLVHFWG